ncbi:MAG: hypothetical protein PHI97_10740 [Desulfobulbus sp.]|nr:hypothetical protein [Desulfobulbus sp.]
MQRTLVRKLADNTADSAPRDRLPIIIVTKGCAVRVLLGIYQEKHEIDAQLNVKGIEGKDICHVGPFTSRTLAMEWMDFMEKRLQPSQVERLVVGHLYPNTWYGTALALE